MAQATDTDSHAGEPARSTHPGELYRFQATRWQKLPAHLVFGILLIVGISVGVKFITMTPRPGQSGLAAIGIGIIVLVSAFWLCGEWRGIGARVVVTEQGLKVRNHLRSYDLSWDEIDDYECRNHHELRLATGRRIRLYGLAEGLGSTARTKREADCLSREIARHHDAA